MRNFLNPYNVEYGKVYNALHDLQLDTIARFAYKESNRQERLLEILENICLDEKTIYYRQAILNDFIKDRFMYHNIQLEIAAMEKAYAEYDGCRSQRAKTKIKSEVGIVDVSMSLRDYAYALRRLLEIFGRLDNLFNEHKPSSEGLKVYAHTVHKRNASEGFYKLREKVEAILESGSSYGYCIKLDDYLVPEEMKYMLVKGKYEGEKFSLFKKKSSQNNKVELNSKVEEDSRRIVVDAYNRLIVIIEDIFETLFDEISYIIKDFIFFEFGIYLYETLGEAGEFVTFPTFGKTINYKKAKDPFLLIRYINEGYRTTVYGNDLVIEDNESALVCGSNNTGKTVFLRTIGIFQVFAQTGLMVPADYAETVIRSDIISIFSGEEKDTNVGGRFEKEAIDIKEIIDSVNERSLVIINEIFQSTFAEDGENALFDILDYFTLINVKWITVTHLLGLLDRVNNFEADVKVFQTTGEEEKYKIKTIQN